MISWKIFVTLLVLVWVKGDTITKADLKQTPDIVSYRRVIAQRNIGIVDKHNRDPTATYGMKAYPQFISLAQDQFADLYLTKVLSKNQDIKIKPTSISEELKRKKEKTGDGYCQFNVDIRWVMRTPIKSQYRCGNGYAMASISSIDMVAQFQGKGWPYLSDQEVTDCATNYGCYSGTVIEAMRFMMFEGAHPIYEYPTVSDRTGVANTCYRRYLSYYSAYRISYWGNVFQNCLNIGETLKRYTPMVVEMNTQSSSYPIQYYGWGIFNSCGSSRSIDHAMVVVGMKFNSEPQNYWILKNSFGEYWGESGYIRISIDGSSCNLCSAAFYPVL